MTIKKQETAILIFTKSPCMGKVKTRLHDAIGVNQATQIYQHLLSRTVRQALASNAQQIELHCSGDLNHPLLQTFEQRHGVILKQQYGDNLGERLAYASEKAIQRFEHVILLGGDCPVLDDTYLNKAIEYLQQHYDAVLGPAEDGGYVLLGFKNYNKAIFSDIPWSTDKVALETEKKFLQLAWHYKCLSKLWDVDMPENVTRLNTIDTYGEC